MDEGEHEADRQANFLFRQVWHKGISETGFKMPRPPAHFTLKTTRGLYQHLGMAPVFDGVPAHYLELEGHCDDCYIGMWGIHGAISHTWEVLDNLSRDDALIFDKIHKKTNGRRVPRKVHGRMCRDSSGAAGWEKIRRRFKLQQRVNMFGSRYKRKHSVSPSCRGCA